MQKAVLINRTNRDRPGGHCCNPYIEFWKKLDRRKARREQARITAEAVREWEEYGDRLRLTETDSLRIIETKPKDLFRWEIRDPMDPLNRIPEYDGADDWDDYRDEYGDQDPVDDTDHSWDWCGYDWNYEPEPDTVTIPREEYMFLKLKAEMWSTHIDRG